MGTGTVNGSLLSYIVTAMQPETRRWRVVAIPHIQIGRMNPMESKLQTQTRNKISGAPIYNIKQAVLDVRLKGDDIHCLAGPFFMARRAGHNCFNYYMTFQLDPECTANANIYTKTPSMIPASTG